MESEFVEYITMQRSDELLSKTELLDHVRLRGRKLSDRNLTYYTSAGLIPRAARFGTRSGAYPKIVLQLVLLVVDARERGLSMDAIGLLVPVWKKLMANRHGSGMVHLGELQHYARSEIASLEANAAIPWVVETVIQSGCGSCSGPVMLIGTNGEPLGDGSALTHVNFLLTSYDEEQNIARPLAFTQLALPGIGLPADDDPNTVVLGSPPKVRVCHDCPPILASEGKASNIREVEEVAN